MTDTSEAIPPSIGRYEIVVEIGRGATSIVYKAFDPKLDRYVALKVIRREDSADSERIRRFQRHALMLSQLRHPNIVPLHDTGEDQGLRYIDMELIEGQTLDAMLNREGTLPPRVAVESLRKTAEALHFAHAHGIFHRDVKPANIIIDARGEPQLTDFGLARQETPDKWLESLTYDGQVLGTLAYMAPEQAEDARRADARSDVFSLGVIMYRTLTGRLPAEPADTIQGTIAQSLRARPRWMREVDPAISSDLDILCHKALEKKPEDRFQTAGDFADELRRWLHEEPLLTRPPSWWEKWRRWVRDNQLAARITLIAAAAVVIVGAVFGAVAVEQRGQAQIAAVREALEFQSRVEAQVRLLLERARQRMQVPTQGRRADAQAILREASRLRQAIVDNETASRFDRELRSLFAATLGLPDLETIESVDIPGNQFTTWQAAIDPEGRGIALGTYPKPLRWEPGRPFEPSTEIDAHGPRPFVSYCPDGRFLVFAAPGEGLELWDGRVTRTIAHWKPEPSETVVAAGFTRDAETVWVCCRKGLVRSFSVPHLSPREENQWSLEADSENVTAAAFNGDATGLAVGYGDGRVKLYDQTGTAIRTLPSGTTEVEALAWSPDQWLLAVGTADGVLQVWHVQDATPGHHFTVNNVGVANIEFSPDGRYVLAGNRDQEMRIWEVATGRLVLSGPGTPWGFSRDGRLLACASSFGASLCRLLDPTTIRTFVGHRGTVDHVRWSRNNGHFVSMDTGYEVRVWDIDQPTPVDVFSLRGNYYSSNGGVAINDDGTLVAVASGGEPTSSVIVRDVAAKKTHGPWELPRGFERVVCTEKNAFLLVREEERNEHREDWQTVAYELDVENGPCRLRVVRPAEPDERRFYTSGLTPDGRYYWWTGPRAPTKNRRAEVWDLASGQLVTRVPRFAADSNAEFGAYVSPDGRHFWVDGVETRRFNLASPADSPIPMPPAPIAVSQDSQFFTYLAIDELLRTHNLTIANFQERNVWLDFHNPDQSAPMTHSVRFSHNDRFLSWGAEDGTVTIADLTELQAEIRKLEETWPD